MKKTVERIHNVDNSTTKTNFTYNSITNNFIHSNILQLSRDIHYYSKCEHYNV